MRSIDTTTIVDPNQTKLRLAYDGRAGIDLSEAIGQDVPRIASIIMELRLYHLPPYRRVPIKLKNLLSSTSYFPDVDGYAVYLERELMCATSIYFSSFAARATCPKCGLTNVKLIDGLCPACSPHSAHLGSSRVQHLSMKAAFMRSTYGCCKCRRTIPFTWFPDEHEYWPEGVCPLCTDRTEVSSAWTSDIVERAQRDHVPRYHLITAPEVGHHACCHCGSTDYPYAYWGLCTRCLIEFQDSYLNQSKLDGLMMTNGPLSALLVRPETSWLKYLATVIPRHRRAWASPTTILVPPAQPKIKIRRASDANIDIKEFL